MNGSTNVPCVPTGRERVVARSCSDVTFVAAPMSIVSAGCGTPARISGPQYAVLSAERDRLDVEDEAVALGHAGG